MVFFFLWSLQCLLCFLSQSWLRVSRLPTSIPCFCLFKIFSISYCRKSSLIANPAHILPFSAITDFYPLSPPGHLQRNISAPPLSKFLSTFISTPSMWKSCQSKNHNYSHLPSCFLFSWILSIDYDLVFINPQYDIVVETVRWHPDSPLWIKDLLPGC